MKVPQFHTFAFCCMLHPPVYILRHVVFNKDPLGPPASVPKQIIPPPLVAYFYPDDDQGLEHQINHCQRADKGVIPQFLSPRVEFDAVRNRY